MDRILARLFLRLSVAMSLVSLLPTSFAHAEAKPENPDFKTLKSQVAQFQARLDRNPGDYEALQAIGIADHDPAMTEPEEYSWLSSK